MHINKIHDPLGKMCANKQFEPITLQDSGGKRFQPTACPTEHALQKTTLVQIRLGKGYSVLQALANTYPVCVFVRLILTGC